MRKRIGQFNSVLLLSLLLVASTSARAAEQKKSAPQPVPSAFSMGVAFSASTNLFETSSPEHFADASVQFAPAYKISSDFTASAALIVAREFTGLQESSISKTSLGLRYAARTLNPYLKLSPALSVALPFVKDARERQSLIVGTSVSSRLLFDLAPAGLTGLTGYYDLAFGKSFHEFETSTTGASNTQLRLTHSLIVQYGLGDFGLELAFVRQTGWTYQGNTNGLFDFNQELAYSITPDLALAVGHNNTGGILAANGADSNMSLFNERSSTVYTSLSFSL